MNFDYTPRMKELQERVRAFMDEHVYPNEARYEEEAHRGERWKVIPVIEELKPKARAAGLWNMFVPPSHGGEPLHHFHFEGTPLILGPRWAASSLAVGDFAQEAGSGSSPRMSMTNTSVAPPGIGH